MSKRLPIYILVDTSGSMDGEKIEQVQRGLSLMKDIFLKTAVTKQSAWVSLILFNSAAEIATGMTPISKFQVPNLEANGRTSYVDALTKLIACYNTDIIKRTTSNQETADFKPILLVFSDGAPTDSSSSLVTTIEDFKANYYRKFAAVVCIYAHESSDSEAEMAKARACLQQICGKSKNGDGTGTMIDVTDDYEKITILFQAVSQSIVQSVHDNRDMGQGLNVDLAQKFGENDFGEIDTDMQFS